ncbi:MAG TPA: phosphoenolpyruvate--protein phosphotransferase [Ktedonobacteraceae bacterium]|nr:phosphoenolpyruvate--protein phosphotransferase [Ktedonobacteraceae bacterium]
MTVGLVIVAHSAQLAAGVAELAGQMTKGAVRIIASGGAGDGVLGTSADVILTAIQTADDTDGVLILLDLGSAILSTEMALEMLDDEQRHRVTLTYAPLVEGAVTAALEASLGHSLAQVKTAAEKIATPAQLQQLKPFEQEATAKDGLDIPPANTDAVSSRAGASPASTVGGKEGPYAVGAIPGGCPAPEAYTLHITLTNPLGLHARPASLFVQTAARFQTNIQVQGHGKQVDATSIIGILSLGARKGDTITLSASGKDAQAALAALDKLAQAGFYEAEPEQKQEQQAKPAASAKPASQRPAGQAGNVWQGITASAGVALGPALLYMPDAPSLASLEQRTIPPAQVTAEQDRLRQALQTTIEELQKLAQQLQTRVGSGEAAIIEAQELMLRDPLLLDASLRMIAEQHSDAASALANVGEKQAATLATLNDPLLAGRAADIRDAASRAVRHLRDLGTSEQDLSAIDRPVILVARDLAPSDTAKLRPETIAGIVTVLGGPTAHAAILARALGIPALAGLDELALNVIQPGDELGLDADNGFLYLRPSPDIRSAITERLAVQQQQKATLQARARRTQAPLYLGDSQIHLLANVGSEAEAEAARQWGAEGIGLLRTEFLFASAATMPDEEEQRRQYASVFRAFSGSPVMQNRPITVRTLDAGADKPMPALQSVIGTVHEANPALGLRGVRIHLAHPELLEQQLSAILLAAADTGINLHIMLPMVTTIEEVEEIQAIFQRVYDGRVQRGIKVPASVPLGIMVEVPSTIVMATELAQRVDFFSIGSNDLTQYTLACDRTNIAVAYLYNPMQPAVLRQIRHLATAARNKGKPVAVCGEMAGDPVLAPVLVGLGVNELSMAPTAIPTVRAALEGFSFEQISEAAEQVCQASTVEQVAKLCADLQQRR